MIFLTALKALQFLAYVEIGVTDHYSDSRSRIFSENIIFNLGNYTEIYGREEPAKFLMSSTN